MSSNDPPHKIALDPQFYKTISARRAAQGLPPLDKNSPFVSDDESVALAEMSRRVDEEAVAEEKAARAARTGSCAKLKLRRETIPGFDRHSRKCQICNHDYMEDIEEAYFNWTSATFIQDEFEISSIDTVYRHARATGLDVLRRENARFAIEKLVEEVDHAVVTGSTIIRAVRALSLIDGKGRWTDPPAKHIIVTGRDLSYQAIASITGLPPALEPAREPATRPMANSAAPVVNPAQQGAMTSTATVSPASPAQRLDCEDLAVGSSASQRKSGLSSEPPTSNLRPPTSNFPNRLSYEELEL
ncbi:MAG: hypothetical protein WA758_02465, partial [Candidatus Acidiferrales bacterium]